MGERLARSREHLVQASNSRLLRRPYLLMAAGSVTGSLHEGNVGSAVAFGVIFKAIDTATRSDRVRNLAQRSWSRYMNNLDSRSRQNTR